MKRRSPPARELRDPKYRQRIVPDHKKYRPAKERQYDWQKELEEYEPIPRVYTPQ